MNQCSPEQYHEAMAGIIARNLLLHVEDPDERQREIIEAASKLAESIADCTQLIRDEGADELMMAQHTSALVGLHRGLRLLRPDGCRGSIAFEIFNDAGDVVTLLHRCEEATARA